jgi:RHS repeat-associated protein
VSTDISLGYDANNRLTNMVDAAGTTRFTYAGFGAVASEDGPWEQDTVSYSYDNGRRRSALSLLQPGASAWAQSYAYDALHRLTNTASPAGAFGYRYRTGQSHDLPFYDWAPGIFWTTAGTVVEKLTYPSAAYFTNYYDDFGRLLAIHLKTSANGMLNAHEYVYDPANRRTNQVRIIGTTGASTATNSTAYTYDNIGQLKTAKGVDTNGTLRLHEQFGYAYDAAGNLNYRTNNELVHTFSVNSLNQLTNVSRSGTLTVSGATSDPATNVTVNATAALRYSDNTFARTNTPFGGGYNATAKDTNGRTASHSVFVTFMANFPTNYYDLNGNLIYDGLKSFEYDDENQLIRITRTNNWKSEFAYDGKMRRRVRQEYVWSSGSSSWVLSNEVRYVYDGNLVIQERNSWNLPQVTYTRGKDLSGSLEGAGGIGGLLARTDSLTLSAGLSGAHAYYVADGNGNVTMLISTQQLAVAKYQYDPFGNALALSGPLAEANLYRFSSKERHENSGLAYYGYRWYSPEVQRWITRDRIEEAGGLNLNQFVLNNPLAFVDREGEVPLPLMCLAGAAASIAVDLAANRGNPKCIDLADAGLSCIQSMTGYGLFSNLNKAMKAAKALGKAGKKAKKARKAAVDAALAVAGIQAAKCVINAPEPPDECE